MLLSPPSPVPPACGPGWGWSASWGRSHMPRSGSGQQGPGMHGPEQLDRHPHPRAHLSICLPSSCLRTRPWLDVVRTPPALLPAGKSGREQVLPGAAQKDSNTSHLSAPPTWALSAFPPSPPGAPTLGQPTCAHLPPVPRPLSPWYPPPPHPPRCSPSSQSRPFTHQPGPATLQSSPPPSS